MRFICCSERLLWIGMAPSVVGPDGRRRRNLGDAHHAYRVTIFRKSRNMLTRSFMRACI
jgi:hypothetical protein